MKKYKKIIILINLVFLILLMTRSILKKEEALDKGSLVLLKLAPKDPRSLMQGDYMRLRYEIARDWRSNWIGNEGDVSKRGFCVVKLDDKGVAETARFQKDKTKQPDEYLIPYTAQSRWEINIGAESFFFQEGKGKKYEKAKYGALRVDNSGNTILVGLYDKELNEIK